MAHVENSSMINPSLWFVVVLILSLLFLCVRLISQLFFYFQLVDLK